MDKTAVTIKPICQYHQQGDCKFIHHSVHTTGGVCNKPRCNDDKLTKQGVFSVDKVIAHLQAFEHPAKTESPQKQQRAQREKAERPKEKREKRRTREHRPGPLQSIGFTRVDHPTLVCHSRLTFQYGSLCGRIYWANPGVDDDLNCEACHETGNILEMKVKSLFNYLNGKTGTQEMFFSICKEGPTNPCAANRGKFQISHAGSRFVVVVQCRHECLSGLNRCQNHARTGKKEEKFVVPDELSHVAEMPGPDETEEKIEWGDD